MEICTLSVRWNSEVSSQADTGWTAVGQESPGYSLSELTGSMFYRLVQ